MKAKCNLFNLVIRCEKRMRGGKPSVLWMEEIQVDSVTLTPRHCLDYVELVRSMCLDGGYYFFTCGCGEPGCAGIHSSVKIRHADGFIHWHSTEPGPERNFTFAAPQYRCSIMEALRYVGKTATGGNEFPIGTMDFTRKRFQRALSAAELACQLDERVCAYGKTLNQFVETVQTIHRRE